MSRKLSCKSNEGVEIIDVVGDVAGNAVMCLVQNEVLLECDLLYGRHDGLGILNLDQANLRQWKAEDWSTRLFKFGLISKPNSAHGFLPNYRQEILLASFG